MCSVSKNHRWVSENQVVVDISSGEEDVDILKDKEYSTWLNETIESVDEKSDSTDVVEILSEMKGGIDSQYRNPNSLSRAVDDDDYDDCVILECDPDKTTKTVSGDDDCDKSAKDDDDDDDDDVDYVLVVGQKGEIACRDFPHPRHSCAKYPFNSTSHEKYCDMCHCYVCDIRAPCSYWCIGVSSIDHCHANDKEKIWKNQREYFRTGCLPTPASSEPTQNILRLSQNSLPQNQVGIRPCSSSTGVDNTLNVRIRKRARYSHRHGPGPPGVLKSHLQSLSNARNSMIHKDRSSYRFNIRSRLASSAGDVNCTRVGFYSDAQVSQSSQPSSSFVAPTRNAEMYTQQRNYQSNVSNHCTTIPGSQSNVYTSSSDPNLCGSGSYQFQTNVDLFAPLETPLTAKQAETVEVQEQPGTNENVLQTKLSDFENWLMENSNQTGPVNPLPGLEDFVGTLTFDFETFLND